jgi:hypothetical protein
MKKNKIIVALLVLIGFGSCAAPRASKSKAPAEQPASEVTVDSLVDRPFMVMYGPPNRHFRPDRIPKQETSEQSTDTDSNTPKTE